MSLRTEATSEVVTEPLWPAGIHRQLAAARVRQVAYVPDGGHRALISLCAADPAMVTVSLTTEEEGIGLAGGAWLGGQRSVVLMQSSGVGNCINALSLIGNCRFPFLALVTMRGHFGEANVWQMPMGQAVETVLGAMDVICLTATTADDVEPTVHAALSMAFSAQQSVAVLLSQRLIGAKSFK